MTKKASRTYDPMKCPPAGKCRRQSLQIAFSPEKAIVPGEVEKPDLRGLLSYFQYRAPNIESAKSPYLDSGSHEHVLEKMLSENKYFSFYAQNYDNKKMLDERALEGAKLCCSCNRFACKRSTTGAKRDPNRPETDLECLLRHLRNSLAHCRVFLFQNGNHVVVGFEDLNTKQNITARLIVNQSILKNGVRYCEKKLNRVLYNDKSFLFGGKSNNE